MASAEGQSGDSICGELPWVCAAQKALCFFLEECLAKLCTVSVGTMSMRHHLVNSSWWKQGCSLWDSLCGRGQQCWPCGAFSQLTLGPWAHSWAPWLCLAQHMSTGWAGAVRGENSIWLYREVSVLLLQPPSLCCSSGGTTRSLPSPIPRGRNTLS